MKKEREGKLQLYSQLFEKRGGKFEKKGLKKRHYFPVSFFRGPLFFFGILWSRQAILFFGKNHQYIRKEKKIGEESASHRARKEQQPSKKERAKAKQQKAIQQFLVYTRGTAFAA